jgi:hypothetical protein
MEKHYGKTVERVVRRNGDSISELARLTKVNRRAVYNWFNQQYLKADIIYRIGCALQHDFSVEFPELFSKDTFSKVYQKTPSVGLEIVTAQSDVDYWKDKYIDLLEKYKELLIANANNMKSTTNYENLAFIKTKKKDVFKAVS